MAYLLSPLYATQPARLDVLPVFFLIEVVAVGLAAAAILALVHRPTLFAIAAVALTAAAAFGVWAATTMENADGQGGLAMLTPAYVGLVAAVVLGGVDELLTLTEKRQRRA